MKKIEMLLAQKEVALNVVNELKIQVDQLESIIAEERVKEFELVFSKELNSYPGVSIEISKWNAMNVMFMINNKEIASITESYYRSNSNVKSVELNYYMTRCDNEFEFKRMMFIGKLSEKILYNQESILYVINNKTNYSNQCNDLKDKLYKAESEVRNIENFISEETRQNIINELMTTGVDWNVNDRFEFASKWTAYGLKNIKVIKSTKSGKTVDLECVFERSEWDKDLNVIIKDEVREINDIKMDWVMSNFRSQIYFN
jgi:hypothetical protein